MPFKRSRRSHILLDILAAGCYSTLAELHTDLCGRVIDSPNVGCDEAKRWLMGWLLGVCRIRRGRRDRVSLLVLGLKLRR